MKKIVIIIIGFASALMSCKKETIIETKETLIINHVSDSIVVFDTTFGKPYQWGNVVDNQITKLINIEDYCSFCSNHILDIYFGSGQSNWVRLPFVDNQNTVSVNYQWTDKTLFIFATGDSSTISSTSYWDRLGLSDLRIKISYKK